MNFTVNLIERGHSDTPSIERVFHEVTKGLVARGINVITEKLPYGNGFVSILRNLVSFRPASADVFHVTGHAHYITLIMPVDKTVLTIHDAGILYLRTGLRRWVLKKLFFDLPVKRLRFITAISEATKAEVVAATGCDPKKITVIGNPVPSSYRPKSKEFNAAEPRILFVGTAPHKNLDRALKALAGIPCSLRVVGELSVDQKQEIERTGVPYTNATALNDDLMRHEYENADIILFPSHFEGFGMPIIEAQAIGRPVITSDLAPMNDVAGGGAVLVNPDEPDEIRNAVIRVIDDNRFRADLVAKGSENVARYSTEQISGQYIELYDRICRKSAPDARL